MIKIDTSIKFTGFYDCDVQLYFESSSFFSGDLRDKELRRAIPRAHIEVGATQEADVSFPHLEN